MTRRRIDRRYFYLGGILFVVAVILGFQGIKNTQNGSAADAKQFNAGSIISDEVMGDYLSMTEQDIYDFMKSKNACNDTNTVKASWYPNLSYHIENGHFVCLADEKFDGESSAHIIYQAAQDYRINPKVLIVLLEKEQGLITDTWPNSTLQYRSATGYGCPDTAACDSQYYGFKNQVRNAAKFFRKNLDGDPNWTNYPIGTNYVLYNPNGACGSSPVNIKNHATGALYTYTPYQPNAAALNAGYGVGDSCSAYGNRNFYLYFTDWFGDTHADTKLSHAQSSISKTYSTVSGSSTLKNSVGNIGHNPTTGIYWQQYQNGYIVGKDGTGYFISQGKIRDVWAKQGFEAGGLGFPVSNIDKNPVTGISWQQYEHGFIVGNDKTGYYISSGKIRDVWAKQGFESGKLGFPIGKIDKNPTTGIYWQQYQNGFIVGNDKNGYYISTGKIRDVWVAQGCEGGSLGFPVANIDQNSKTGIYWQQYQNGFIVGNDKNGYYISTGKIREIWAEQGFESGRLGYPTGNQVYHKETSTYTQNYEHGIILFDTKAYQTGIIYL